MTILNIQPDIGNPVGTEPSIIYIYTNDTTETVTTAGYLTSANQTLGFPFEDSQMALVFTTDETSGWYNVSVVDGIASLVASVNPGSVTLPVTSGDFTVFDGTEGVLKDAGYSPSNAAKTKVVMANAATTSGSIAAFTDTAGTVGNGPVAANVVLSSAIVTPDVGSNLIAVDVTVGQAALASGGSVTLYASSAAKQYKIRNMWVNRGGTNFSGGGGDRLLSITDNTTVYSVIPAASLQTLANTGWGVTGLPFPASAAINTSTAAGASIVAKYSGGAADYTAGSVVISLLLERVA